MVKGKVTEECVGEGEMDGKGKEVEKDDYRVVELLVGWWRMRMKGDFDV